MIDKAGSTPIVTCSPSTVTYNSSPQTRCHRRRQRCGVGPQLLTPSYSDNTNAGTTTASYTFAGDANHDGSTDAQHFASRRRLPPRTSRARRR